MGALYLPLRSVTGISFHGMPAPTAQPHHGHVALCWLDTSEPRGPMLAHTSEQGGMPGGGSSCSSGSPSNNTSGSAFLFGVRLRFLGLVEASVAPEAAGEPAGDLRPVAALGTGLPHSTSVSRDAALGVLGRQAAPGSGSCALRKGGWLWQWGCRGHQGQQCVRPSIGVAASHALRL